MSNIQPRVPSQALSLYIYDEGHPFLDYILCYSSEMGWLINEGKTVTSNILKISPTGTWLSESCYLFIGPTNNIEEMTSLFLAEDYSSIPDSVEIPQNLLSSPEYYFGIKLSAGDNPLISEAIPNSAQVITSKTIQITCSTPSSQIYYTLDGNVPSESSILYENQIEVEPGTIIKAIGIKEGWIESDTASLEIKQTLPTPEIELQGTSRFLFLTNYDEFPASTEFYVSTYNNDGTIQTFENEKAIIQDSGQVITESETLIAMWSGYATLLAKCEGYEDSLGTTQQ